jgi:hypothetical protein
MIADSFVCFPLINLAQKDIAEYNYLGVLLSKSGNFSMARKAQVEKATKVMFEVLKRGKVHK